MPTTLVFKPFNCPAPDSFSHKRGKHDLDAHWPSVEGTVTLARPVIFTRRRRTGSHQGATVWHHLPIINPHSFLLPRFCFTTHIRFRVSSLVLSRFINRLNCLHHLATFQFSESTPLKVNFYTKMQFAKLLFISASFVAATTAKIAFTTLPTSVEAGVPTKLAWGGGDASVSLVSRFPNRGNH